VFIGNSELLAEGEGALHASLEDCDKRSKSDFALWKKSKDHGEVEDDDYDDDGFDDDDDDDYDDDGNGNGNDDGGHGKHIMSTYCIHPYYKVTYTHPPH
jgi:hypothetical protein